MVILDDALHIVCRGETHAHAVGTDFLRHGTDDHLWQTPAIFRAAAKSILALIGRRRHELVQQVAVGAVDLHAVNTSINSPARALAEFVHDARQLFLLQLARHRRVHLASEATHGSAPVKGARRLRVRTVDQVWVAGAAAVHDLHEQGAAFLVHAVCDGAPAFCLLVGRNARLARECAVGPRREGSLRNHQTGRGTLRVILLV